MKGQVYFPPRRPVPVLRQLYAYRDFAGCGVGVIFAPKVNNGFRPVFNLPRQSIAAASFRMD